MILITPPNQPVVTDADLLAHLRVTDADEQAQVSAMGAAATAYLDGWGGVLGRAIMPQVWRQEFTGWGDLALSLPDVTAVAVTYEDAEGNEQPATSAALRKDGEAWVVEADGPDASRVFVNMTCALPAPKRPVAAMIVKLLVAHWYLNREAVGEAMHEVPMSADALISSLRFRRL